MAVFPIKCKLSVLKNILSNALGGGVGWGGYGEAGCFRGSPRFRAVGGLWAHLSCAYL